MRMPTCNIFLYIIVPTGYYSKAFANYFFLFSSSAELSKIKNRESSLILLITELAVNHVVNLGFI